MKTGGFTQTYNGLILKAVGVVLVLGTLVDYIVLATPPNFLNSEWFAALIGEWVARGAVPLLGLGLLFLGVWFDHSRAHASHSNSNNGLKGLPSAAFVLSALLGLLFLGLAPLYLNSSRLTSAAQTRQINQQAAQTEQQLNALLEQQRARVNAIVSNEEQLQQLQQQLNSLDLPEDQQAQLKQVQSTLDKVKSDPKALDQEVAKARTQALQRIKEKQAEALSNLQAETWRDRIHITLSSLVFAIGYLVIAWTGFGGSHAAGSRAKRRR